VGRVSRHHHEPGARLRTAVTERILSSGLAGKLVAEAVAGTAERFDVFARLPHRDFPGGALLRRPSLVLAMLYYRLKDLL
jgi:gamma-glutamylputrescine oxidase